MKKLLILLTLLIAPAAFAQHHHRGHYGYRAGAEWVAPLVIGGVIGYSISQRPPTPPTVIINGQPNYSYTDTYELVYIDGIAYRKHKLFMNGVWQDVLIRL